MKSTPTPNYLGGISENELQRKYGTNWTEKNFQTILNWTFIAAFHIESLEYAISYYRKIIRNNIVLGLVLSTASGTISSARFGISQDSSLNLITNILFTVMSFTIAVFTGTIKIYQIQERLENFIKIKQEWIVFSTTLASELQLPVNLRHDAYYIIIKNKSKYLDLLKIDSDIPTFIKDNVRKKLIDKNINGPLKDHIDNLNITSLSDIIIQISSIENERFILENDIDAYYKDLEINFKNIILKELEDKFTNNLENQDQNQDQLQEYKQKILNPISEKISKDILEDIKNLMDNSFINDEDSSEKIKVIFNDVLSKHIKNIIENYSDTNILNLSKNIKEENETKVLHFENISKDLDYDESTPLSNV